MVVEKAKKLEQEALKKELVLKQKGGGRDKMEEVDDMIIDAIEAKLSILK